MKFCLEVGQACMYKICNIETVIVRQNGDGGRLLDLDLRKEKVWR